MRLTTTLLVSALAACFLPCVATVQHNSRSGSLAEKRATHKSTNAQVIAQRQHHVHRDLIDLCLNLEAGVLAPILHILDPLAANLRLCLCIKDLNIFLDSDVGILLGGILGGKDGLLTKIKLLIRTKRHRTGGGCITRHGFADGPSSANGIDCGRLPGVVASYCSDYRCVITQCRAGWHLDSKRNECVNVSTGAARRGVGSRMNKAGKRSDMEVETVSELAEQLNAYALLVINLSNASQAVSAAPTSPHATSSPAASIDYVDSINTVLAATIYALNSPTVVALVANIDIIVKVNALAVNTFDECGCIGTLGLESLYDDLIAVVNASLTLQDWCGSHPVGKPSDSSDSTIVPNTSGAPIRIGLDGALKSLGLASKNSHIDVFGVGPGLTGATNNILNGVGLGPANVHPRSPEPPTAVLNPELLGKTRVLVDAVIALKSCEPNLPPGVSVKPYHIRLIDAIFQAVANLLDSHTVASYVGNVDTIVNVNQIVTDVLVSCGCVGDLDALINQLLVVTEVALGLQHWCAHNPVVGPALNSSTVPGPQPTGTPTSPPSVTPTASASPDSTIIVDLDLTSLLDSLGLGPIAGEGLIGLGGLLGGLLAPTSTTIDGNVTSGTIVTTDLQVDPELVLQIQGLANLALVIQNGSIALPAAPFNSPPIVSETPLSENVPANTNLVVGILQATLNLCTSGTVGDFLHNLQVLLDVNTLVQNSLAGCGCVDQLGLAGLVKDSSGSPLLDVVINLGLGDLVSALTLGLTTDTNSIADLSVLLNTLVDVVLQIQTHSTTLPPAPTPIAPTASAHPSTSLLPPSQGLIDDLLQEVALLLNSTIDSTTTEDILASVNGLLNLGGLLSDSMDHCGCVTSLGLEALEDDIDALLGALLTLHAWCEYHPRNTGAGGSAPNTIKIDTHDLLTALGLDNVLQVKSELPGLGVSDIVNPLLHGVGLGGVRRWWFMG
ncbi:hypothetical protein C0991_007754 [Blastosporella zonata]|nr:hypothetical protein C0991_007754 [Blastosporella zonata]